MKMAAFQPGTKAFLGSTGLLVLHAYAENTLYPTVIGSDSISRVLVRLLSL